VTDGYELIFALLFGIGQLERAERIIRIAIYGGRREVPEYGRSNDLDLWQPKDLFKYFLANWRRAAPGVERLQGEK
jgi:hypothetical protein